MNTLCLNRLKATLLASVLGVSALHAQTVQTVTTTTTQGIVREYGPQAIVVSQPEGAPVRYIFRESTAYVDEAGTPVSASVVRSGLPVTVHYTQDGDALVASRVVVRTAAAPAAAVTTTVAEPVTATGVINAYSPDGLVVRTEASAEPLRYSFSKSTTYVDEAGNPVSVETVRSGLPVTVQYIRDGDTLFAKKVIVRRAAVVPVPAPAPVIERTTRTTTTVRDADDDDEN